MKKFFKLMGIALLASGMMFASCGKDDDNNGGNNNGGNNNGGNNGGNTETPTAGTVTVKFGSDTWTPSVAEISTRYAESYGIGEYVFFKVAQQYPFADLLISVTPGNYSYTAEEYTEYEGTDSAYMGYYWGDQTYSLYAIGYAEQWSTTYNNNLYFDWAPKSATLNVTAFDLNSLKATWKLTAEMYDNYNWLMGNVNDADDADTMDLEINVQNFTFTETSSN